VTNCSKKLPQEISKREKYLKRFPPDTVYLLVVLARYPKKPSPLREEMLEKTLV
jgi:hypothetical protein